MMMTRILPLVLLPIHPLFSPVHSIREHPWQMWRCSVKIDGFYITQFCRSFFSSTDSSYLVNCIFSLFPLHHTFGYESEKKKVWQVWRKVAVLTLLPCDRFSRSRNEGASLCRKYVGMLIPSTRLSFFCRGKEIVDCSFYLETVFKQPVPAFDLITTCFASGRPFKRQLCWTIKKPD